MPRGGRLQEQQGQWEVRRGGDGGDGGGGGGRELEEVERLRVHELALCSACKKIHQFRLQGYS